MMMKLVSLFLSVSLVANVVGCCMRTFGGGENADLPPASAQSQSAPESSAPAPESTPEPPVSSSVPEQPQPESAPEAEPLPDTLTFDYLFGQMDADSVEIYASESGKRITAGLETAKANIGKLGVDALQKTDVAEPLSPEDAAYISVSGGDIVFYLFKGESYGTLVTPEQSACYTLPGGLYSKIQLAMMFL